MLVFKITILFVTLIILFIIRLDFLSIKYFSYLFIYELCIDKW